MNAPHVVERGGLPRRSPLPRAAGRFLRLGDEVLPVRCRSAARRRDDRALCLAERPAVHGRRLESLRPHEVGDLLAMLGRVVERLRNHDPGVHAIAVPGLEQARNPIHVEGQPSRIPPKTPMRKCSELCILDGQLGWGIR